MNSTFAVHGESSPRILVGGDRNGSGERGLVGPKGEGGGGRIKFTVHSRSLSSLPPHWRRRRNVPFSVSLSLPPSPLFFLFFFHVEKRKEGVGGGRRRPPPQLQHTKHYTTTHRFPPTYIRRPISKRCECMHAKGKEGRRDPRCQLMKSGLLLPSFLWRRRRSPGSAIPPPSSLPSSFSPVKPFFKRSVYTYQTWKTLYFLYATAMLKHDMSC